jgi:hypothetical protein
MTPPSLRAQRSNPRRRCPTVERSITAGLDCFASLAMTVRALLAKLGSRQNAS